MNLSLNLIEGESADEYALLWTGSLAAAATFTQGFAGLDNFLD
jgi:hypothetical protein